MKLRKTGRFMRDGITMTAVALLMRSVAVAFNSYVARTVGAEAVGLYSLLSGIYGFSVTLALSGLHLSVTRLVSEYIAVGDTASAVAALKKTFSLALFFGSVASLILFFVSDTAASVWLHELRVVAPLKWLCISLPAASLSSVVNGYFTAVRRVYKNALSQSVEMAAKIGTTIVLFSLSSDSNAESACIMLALGSVIAELCALLFNLCAYIFDRKYHLKSFLQKKPEANIAGKILGISMPVALTSYFRSALISLEHSLIPNGLTKHGADRASALASYGTLGSMALTVINFPYALIGSFSSLLIPEVTESRALGKKRHIRYLAHRTYQSTAVFAFCLMGFFFEFSNEIGVWLYSSTLAGEYVKQLSFIVPIMYTDTVTDSLLKGMGEQLYSMRVNIADAMLSVTLVWFLVPRYGIPGYIATVYIAETVNAALSISKASRVCGVGKEAVSLYIRSAFCTIGGLSVCRLLSNIFLPHALIRLLIYFLSYFLFVKATDIFTKEDIRWLKGIFNKKEPLQ